MHVRMHGPYSHIVRHQGWTTQHNAALFTRAWMHMVQCLPLVQGGLHGHVGRWVQAYNYSHMGMDLAQSNGGNAIAKRCVLLTCARSYS